jgi:hypothetical protein
MPTQEPSARKAAEHRAGPSARGCTPAEGTMPFSRKVCVCIRQYTVVCLSASCRRSCIRLVAWPYFFLAVGLYLPRETHFYDNPF